MSAFGTTRLETPARALTIALGFIAAVGARSALTFAGVDALVLGGSFAIGLVAIAVVAQTKLAISTRSVVAGIGGGLVLVALALLLRSSPGPQVLGTGAVAPWAVVTIAVALGEELVLRGSFFDAYEPLVGSAAVVALTSALFALMHVPLYGWHVVPLDLGVGVWLAGLRLLTGSVGAPAIAHVVADVAAWWL